MCSARHNLIRLEPCDCTHVNFGGFGKGSDRMNVVVENDDAHHHPHAEQHSVCVGEPAAVLPTTERVTDTYLLKAKPSLRSKGRKKHRGQGDHEMTESGRQIHSKEFSRVESIHIRV